MQPTLPLLLIFTISAVIQSLQMTVAKIDSFGHSSSFRANQLIVFETFRVDTSGVTGLLLQSLIPPVAGKKKYRIQFHDLIVSNANNDKITISLRMLNTFSATHQERIECDSRRFIFSFRGFDLMPTLVTLFVFRVSSSSFILTKFSGVEQKIENFLMKSHFRMK